MQDMPTVSVRLTEEAKKELLEYGGLSKGAGKASGSTSRLRGRKKFSAGSKTSKGRTPLRRPQRKR